MIYGGEGVYDGLGGKGLNGILWAMGVQGNERNEWVLLE